MTDNNTGFMWEKKVAGFGSCLGAPHAVDARCDWVDATGAWIAALNAGAGYAGHTDWRLPNVKELQSVVDDGRVGPAIHPTLGPTASSFYWSATSNVTLPPFAWGVFFGDGVVGFDPKFFGDHVRAVRSGP